MVVSFDVNKNTKLDGISSHKLVTAVKPNKIILTITAVKYILKTFLVYRQIRI